MPKKAEAPATDFWACRKYLYDCHEECVESRWVGIRDYFKPLKCSRFLREHFFVIQEVVK